MRKPSALNAVFTTVNVAINGTAMGALALERLAMVVGNRFAEIARRKRFSVQSVVNGCAVNAVPRTRVIYAAVRFVATVIGTRTTRSTIAPQGNVTALHAFVKAVVTLIAAETFIVMKCLVRNAVLLPEGTVVTSAWSTMIEDDDDHSE